MSCRCRLMPKILQAGFGPSFRRIKIIIVAGIRPFEWQKMARKFSHGVCQFCCSQLTIFAKSKRATKRVELWPCGISDPEAVSGSSTIHLKSSPKRRFFHAKHHNRCKNYNKTNKKLEQITNRVNVVKITSIKLNKSIAFLQFLC